jgi:hypothetical protein
VSRWPKSGELVAQMGPLKWNRNRMASAGQADAAPRRLAVSISETKWPQIYRAFNFRPVAHVKFWAGAFA